MQAEAYLGLNWTWKIEESKDDDCWLVTVQELPDFFAAGDSEARAWGNAREALLSHLRSYIATGAAITTPPARFTSAGATAGFGRFAFV